MGCCGTRPPPKELVVAMSLTHEMLASRAAGDFHQPDCEQHGRPGDVRINLCDNDCIWTFLDEVAEALAQDEPNLIPNPWVAFDGTTSDYEEFATRTEAESAAADYIEDSHDYESWDEAVSGTFVALIVARATEILIGDDAINYELQSVSKIGTVNRG
jgi:hypothetical protein